MRTVSRSTTLPSLRALASFAALAFAGLLPAACGSRSALDAGSSGLGDGVGGPSRGATGGGGGGGAPAPGHGGSDGGSLPPGCWSGMPGPKLVTVQLSDRTFCMDATEVTNADYAAWLDTVPDPAVQSPSCLWNEAFVPWDQVWPFPPGQDQHPVAGVDHCDAEAYCRWAGKRLCRADPEPDGINEWVAACTREGQQEYPYGDSFVPGACNGPELHVEGTVPVASLSSCEGGHEGGFDLVGNVSEWADNCEVDDWPTPYCRTLGGGWWAEVESSCSTRVGFFADIGAAFVGFRCCRDAE